MNKEHLTKLQQKVNRLMRTSSEESQQEARDNKKTANRNNLKIQDIQPETVRRCIDLMRQNHELKFQLQKQRKNNQDLRKQLLKTKRQKTQQTNLRQAKLKQQLKSHQINTEQIRKSAKLQAQLGQAHKKIKMLQQIINKERTKNKNLCHFINRNIPLMQQNIDKLNNKIDAKLQSHFLSTYDD